MSAFLHKLSSASPCLIVSLPRNDAEMARAAEAAGADAIKVHINVTHHATGITFGKLAEERPALAEVLAAVKIPVGLVPGEDLALTRETLFEIEQMGFALIDAYAHTLPAWARGGKMDLWAAIDSTFSAAEIEYLARLPWVDAVECAIIPTQAYGQLLSVRDLARYRQLSALITKPFVVPSQRRLRVEDIPSLLAVGVKNIMIGAVVTGMERQGIESATRAFRAAMDAQAAW